MDLEPVYEASTNVDDYGTTDLAAHSPGEEVVDWLISTTSLGEYVLHNGTCKGLDQSHYM